MLNWLRDSLTTACAMFKKKSDGMKCNLNRQYRYRYCKDIKEFFEDTTLSVQCSWNNYGHWNEAFVKYL